MVRTKPNPRSISAARTSSNQPFVSVNHSDIMTMLGNGRIISFKRTASNPQNIQGGDLGGSWLAGSSILAGCSWFSTINHAFWGTPIYGNPHLSLSEKIRTQGTRRGWLEPRRPLPRQRRAQAQPQLEQRQPRPRSMTGGNCITAWTASWCTAFFF